MTALFEFFTFAFPKAGIQMGLPVTISLVLFLFVFIRYFNQTVSAFNQVPLLGLTYLLFSFSIIISVLFNLDQYTTQSIAFVLVLIGSPLAIVVGRNIDKEKFKTIMAVSVIIVGGYSVIQWFFGILNTAIPGVTYTFGQNLMDKPIGYGHSATLEAVKMPSTYQNGNASGLFFALSIPVLFIWSVKSKRNKILKVLAILLGIIGLILSGSRAIMIPFAGFSLLLLLFYFRTLKRRIAFLFISISMFLSLFLILYLLVGDNEILQQAYERYVIQTLNDPTGNGRTTLIMIALTQVKMLDASGLFSFIIMGFSEYRLMSEGLLYLLFANGVLSFVSFLFVLFLSFKTAYKKNKIESIGFMCVIVAFIVDSSFLYPPALINFFLFLGVLTQPENMDHSVRKRKRIRITW